jgi:hypothetical protein
MKKRIGRTMFWFYDSDEMLYQLTEKFFALANLLNRLLNEKYEGGKIEFINIDFANENHYKKYPVTSADNVHYYGGHLRYYGQINFDLFYKLSEENQTLFVWNKGFQYLKLSAVKIKNQHLLEACEYACHKGLEMRLNPDYKMIEADLILYNFPVNASVWVNFKNDGMYSKFFLEKGGKVVFEKDIDSTINAIEFFLEMYKKIEVKNNDIVIKGHYGVEYLPLRIIIDKALLDF